MSHHYGTTINSITTMRRRNGIPHHAVRRRGLRHILATITLTALILLATATVPAAEKQIWDVLILTPDAVEWDSPLLLDALDDFADLSVTVWDSAQGNPAAGDLAAFDVVLIGNLFTWEYAGLDPDSVGDAIADYIDAGGKVIECSYVQSYDGWGFSGRYLSDGYSPFTEASEDFWVADTLEILDAGHPLFNGVSGIEDHIGHQNPGLAPGATLLARWAGEGNNAIAVNGNAVAINMLLTDTADWTGDMPQLLYNAITWLSEGSPDDEYVQYLPHFAVMPGEWRTELTLGNPTATARTVQIEAFDEAGVVKSGSVDVELPPCGGISQDLTEIFPGLGIESGWLRIVATTPEICGIMKFTALVTQGTSSLPLVATTADRLVYPLMENSAGWSSGVAVVNPSDEEIACTALAYDFDGILVEMTDILVPARGKYVRLLADVFAKALPPKVMLDIRSPLPVTGFALTMNADYTTIVAVPAAPATAIASSLAVEPDTLNLSPGGQDTATISGGTPPYSAESSDTKVATATVDGDTLTVTAQGEGNATVTVRDSVGGAAQVQLSVTSPTYACEVHEFGDTVTEWPVNSTHQIWEVEAEQDMIVDYVETSSVLKSAGGVLDPKYFTILVRLENIYIAMWNFQLINDTYQTFSFDKEVDEVAMSAGDTIQYHIYGPDISPSGYIMGVNHVKLCGTASKRRPAPDYPRTELAVIKGE